MDAIRFDTASTFVAAGERRIVIWTFASPKFKLTFESFWRVVTVFPTRTREARVQPKLYHFVRTTKHYLLLVQSTPCGTPQRRLSFYSIIFWQFWHLEHERLRLLSKAIVYIVRFIFWDTLPWRSAAFCVSVFISVLWYARFLPTESV